MTVFLFCLKVEMDTNGVFVPRYAGKIFIDHWTLLGQTHSLQIWIGKRNRTQRFVLTFFSLHGPQRLRLLALAAGLARLPFESAVSNDRRRTTHIFGFVANPFWSPCFCYSGEKGTKRFSWRQIWSSNCVPLIRIYFSRFGSASELRLVVGDIAEAKAMSFALRFPTFAPSPYTAQGRFNWFRNPICRTSLRDSLAGYDPGDNQMWSMTV